MARVEPSPTVPTSAGAANAPLPGRPSRWAIVFAPLGHWLMGGLTDCRRIGAFALITLTTVATKSRVARRVIRPLIQRQILRAGVRVLPIVCFLGAALGVAIVGQTTQLLMQVGQTKLIGPLLVNLVVRELAPLSAALVVLARVGTATVTELGTARALGEVEALEALGIDPIHYLVVPRVVGITTAVVSLTVYVILFALGVGYLFSFLRGLPMPPGEFFGIIAGSLGWVDFPLLAMKTMAFGFLASLIICYHGLAQPLRLEEVGEATTRTVAQTVVACLLVDALFVPVYIFL
ncbi:MAG: ABC transporter permease [Verrucomicrobia bacterium]|nr:MAG: ABC transporter permease [Verrucomicrobiota bacterium]